jgi:hypothetical protein
MLQGSLNTDGQVSRYSALPLYTADLHAVNYRMKYLCGEVLFCALFIMKGMATRSTALPGKKQPLTNQTLHIIYIYIYISHLAVLYNNQLSFNSQPSQCLELCSRSDDTRLLQCTLLSLLWL